MMPKNTLPSVDAPVAQSTPKTATPAPKPAEEPRTAAVEGYIPRRIDAKLTRDQARVLRDKLRSLQDSGAKTADGRFVTSRTQAIQWILENEVAK